jgi:hypothetical protein
MGFRRNSRNSRRKARSYASGHLHANGATGALRRLSVDVKAATAHSLPDIRAAGKRPWLARSGLRSYTCEQPGSQTWPVALRQGIGVWLNMSRRKPQRRLVVERHSDNDKRRLREPPPDDDFRTALAARALFAGSGKHKLQPRAFGLEPAPSDGDDTYCDGHAGFTPQDMSRARELLRRGILAGLVGHIDSRGEPSLVWTVDDNGWIYEGRITIPTQAAYHAYPVLPSDAFAKKIIARYTHWVYDHHNHQLVINLQNARERYP